MLVAFVQVSIPNCAGSICLGCCMYIVLQHMLNSLYLHCAGSICSGVFLPFAGSICSCIGTYVVLAAFFHLSVITFWS